MGRSREAYDVQVHMERIRKATKFRKKFMTSPFWIKMKAQSCLQPNGLNLAFQHGDGQISATAPNQPDSLLDKCLHVIGNSKRKVSPKWVSFK